MQTMSRTAAGPTPQELRAEAARLEARARELEAQGSRTTTVPVIYDRSGRDEARARALARRRRINALRAFALGVGRVAKAIVVGVVAGVLMYLLANAGVMQLVEDDGATTTPVTTPVTTPAAPLTP